MMYCEAEIKVLKKTTGFSSSTKPHIELGLLHTKPHIELVIMET